MYVKRDLKFCILQDLKYINYNRLINYLILNCQVYHDVKMYIFTLDNNLSLQWNACGRFSCVTDCNSIRAIYSKVSHSCLRGRRYNEIACIASLANTSLPKSHCERWRNIAFAICHASMLLEATGGIFDLIAGREAPAMPISVHGQLTFGILQVIAAQ